MTQKQIADARLIEIADVAKAERVKLAISQLNPVLSNPNAAAIAALLAVELVAVALTKGD